MYSTLCAANQSLLYMLQISSENLHKGDVLETPCLLPWLQFTHLIKTFSHVIPSRISKDDN